MAKFEKLASIYAGDFLDGYLPHTNGLLDEWVPQVRQEYKSKLVLVLHWLATYHFERAQYDRCEAYLNRILKLEPLDETALRYSMKILTNTGHRNQALVRYHDFHRKLQANLHLMPEEETILLAQKIRTGGDTIADHINPFRGNLPFSQQEINGEYLPDSTIPFFGREQEIGQILDLLESREHRVICIKGVIGSGKTRVALQAAVLDNNTWADHIYLVLINKESSFSNDLISTMVHALGVPSNNSFEHRKNLVNFLHDKESLIIIDNLDEFPNQADVIQYLVGLCPKIKFIITTRKHLGIRGEKVVYFNGLNYPALQVEAIDFNAIDLEAFVNRYSALQLFNEVATRARSDFEINPATISFVIQICEMLIGLPLGIELAASYARLFTCEEIHDGVYGCLNGIEGVHAFISDRHGNFKKRFEYVWESLTETEKELVKIVEKYPEGVVTDDLLADKLATIETLVTLQDKSTLIRLPGSMVKLHPLVRFYVSQ
jgi:predicted ATPase